MKSPVSVAANMSADERKSLGTLALLKTQQIADLADQQGVSRQFVHRQKTGLCRQSIKRLQPRLPTSYFTCR